jgi:hypothetical protein
MIDAPLLRPDPGHLVPDFASADQRRLWAL